MLSGGNLGCRSDSHTAQLSQWSVYIVCAKSFAADVGACVFPYKLCRQLLSHLGILQLHHYSSSSMCSRGQQQNNSENNSFSCRFHKSGTVKVVSLSLSLARLTVSPSNQPAVSWKCNLRFIAKRSFRSGGPGYTLPILQLDSLGVFLTAQTRRQGQTLCHRAAGGTEALPGNDAIDGGRGGSAESGRRVHKMSLRAL